ncbi:hypothetical protein ACLBVW_35590, partial [Pseudomonas aeruginosa]|uniref:hypothetical protein n=1 Tax=Pseudomonas aeruginosa TaxID=287 RepID=UPI00396A4914
VQEEVIVDRHHDDGTKKEPAGLRADTLAAPHAARLKSVSVRRSRNRQTLNRGVPLACQWVPI